MLLSRLPVVFTVHPAAAKRFAAVRAKPAREVLFSTTSGVDFNTAGGAEGDWELVAVGLAGDGVLVATASALGSRDGDPEAEVDGV